MASADETTAAAEALVRAISTARARAHSQASSGQASRVTSQSTSAAASRQPSRQASRRPSGEGERDTGSLHADGSAALLRSLLPSGLMSGSGPAPGPASGPTTELAAGIPAALPEFSALERYKAMMRMNALVGIGVDSGTGSPRSAYTSSGGSTPIGSPRVVARPQPAAVVRERDGGLAAPAVDSRLAAYFQARPSPQEGTGSSAVSRTASNQQAPFPGERTPAGGAEPAASPAAPEPAPVEPPLAADRLRTPVSTQMQRLKELQRLAQPDSPSPEQPRRLSGGPPQPVLFFSGPSRSSASASTTSSSSAGSRAGGDGAGGDSPSWVSNPWEVAAAAEEAFAAGTSGSGASLGAAGSRAARRSPLSPPSPRGRTPTAASLSRADPFMRNERQHSDAAEAARVLERRASSRRRRLLRERAGSRQSLLRQIEPEASAAAAAPAARSVAESEREPDEEELLRFAQGLNSDALKSFSAEPSPESIKKTGGVVDSDSDSSEDGGGGLSMYTSVGDALSMYTSNNDSHPSSTSDQFVAEGPGFNPEPAQRPTQAPEWVSLRERFSSGISNQEAMVAQQAAVEALQQVGRGPRRTSSTLETLPSGPLREAPSLGNPPMADPAELSLPPIRTPCLGPTGHGPTPIRPFPKPPSRPPSGGSRRSSSSGGSDGSAAAAARAADRAVARGAEVAARDWSEPRRPGVDAACQTDAQLDGGQSQEEVLALLDRLEASSLSMVEGAQTALEIAEAEYVSLHHSSKQRVNQLMALLPAVEAALEPPPAKPSIKVPALWAGSPGSPGGNGRGFASSPGTPRGTRKGSSFSAGQHVTPADARVLELEHQLDVVCLWAESTISKLTAKLAAAAVAQDHRRFA